MVLKTTTYAVPHWATEIIMPANVRLTPMQSIFANQAFGNECIAQDDPCVLHRWCHTLLTLFALIILLFSLDLSCENVLRYGHKKFMNFLCPYHYLSPLVYIWVLASAKPYGSNTNCFLLLNLRIRYWFSYLIFSHVPITDGQFLSPHLLNVQQVWKFWGFQGWGQ